MSRWICAECSEQIDADDVEEVGSGLAHYIGEGYEHDAKYPDYCGPIYEDEDETDPTDWHDYMEENA